MQYVVDIPVPITYNMSYSKIGKLLLIEVLMQQFNLIANTDLFNGYSYGFKRNSLTKTKALSNVMVRLHKSGVRIKALGFVGSKFIRTESKVRLICEKHGKFTSLMCYDDFMKSDVTCLCVECQTDNV